ncbi:MAG: hypothetical protein PVG27_11335 [Chloroflexota bacterium]|jgi:hypothetical protein
MTGSANPTQATSDHGFLAPKPEAKPVDHCFRCGVETPAGVGLCEAHNRGHLSGPSATQMHATVFIGIALGVLGFFLLASLSVTTTGPYASDVTSAAAGPDGGVALAYSVTNEGADEGIADCRVTRDGVPRPDDLAFRTTAVPGGETVIFERQLAPPPEGSVRYDPEAMTVICT